MPSPNSPGYEAFDGQSNPQRSSPGGNTVYDCWWPNPWSIYYRTVKWFPAFVYALPASLDINGLSKHGDIKVI